jgi:DNA-binding XRE family transcriptional regulator
VTIRYVRQGLRVVRVPSGPLAPSEAPVPGARPEPFPAARLVEEADDLATRLARFRGLLLEQARRARVSAHYQAMLGSRKPRQRDSGLTPEHVVAARRLAGLTQRQLADRLDMARSTVAEVEAGNRYVNETLGAWVVDTLRGGAGR